MTRELGLVRIAVGVSAAQSVLLVHEEHRAQRSGRLEPERADEAHRLEDFRATRAVVVSSLTDVPVVEVRADEHDLVGAALASDLPDDVVRRHVRILAAIEPETHRDALLLVQERGEPLGAGRADGGRGHALHAILVPHGSGVGEIVEAQGERAHDRAGGAVARGLDRTRVRGSIARS